jgi:hypothetical protein
MTSDITKWFDDSSVTPRISEISLYPYLTECLSSFANVSSVSSVRVNGETDILATIDGTKVVFEIKATDSYVALLDAELQNLLDVMSHTKSSEPNNTLAKGE